MPGEMTIHLPRHVDAAAVRDRVVADARLFGRLGMLAGTTATGLVLLTAPAVMSRPWWGYRSVLDELAWAALWLGLAVAGGMASGGNLFCSIAGKVQDGGYEDRGVQRAAGGLGLLLALAGVVTMGLHDIVAAAVMLLVGCAVLAPRWLVAGALLGRLADRLPERVPSAVPGKTVRAAGLRLTPTRALGPSPA